MYTGRVYWRLARQLAHFLKLFRQPLCHLHSCTSSPAPSYSTYTLYTWLQWISTCKSLDILLLHERYWVGTQLLRILPPSLCGRSMISSDDERDGCVQPLAVNDTQFQLGGLLACECQHAATSSSLEPRLSVPDFVSQLWRKSPSSASQNPGGRKSLDSRLPLQLKASCQNQSVVETSG